MTKKEKFNLLLSIVEKQNLSPGTYNELRNFILQQIKQIENKAIVEKQRYKGILTAEELKIVVYNALSDDDLMSIDDIVKIINCPDITPRKVANCLINLEKENKVEKVILSIQGKHLNVYRRS